MINEKYISKRKHPTADLYIYNYTAKAQYDWVWNEATEQCRGLIMDGTGNVIARPFRKFFNLDEGTVLPLVPFEVAEKLGGSLGILYWVGDEPYIATRGSFESDQAVEAKRILDAKYRDAAMTLDRDLTYLFEIVYPGARRRSIIRSVCGRIEHLPRSSSRSRHSSFVSKKMSERASLLVFSRPMVVNGETRPAGRSRTFSSSSWKAKRFR